MDGETLPDNDRQDHYRRGKQDEFEDCASGG